MKLLGLPLLLLLLQPASADPVDDLVKREMERQRIPGLVVGIVRDGQLVRTSAYGMANLELDAPMKPEYKFEIGSITKQFTAFATMLLVDEGKLSLDDPVSKHLPEAPAAWNGVTLRHMLYQNSGLPEYVMVDGLWLDQEFDRKTYFEKMRDQKMDFAPGTAWSYSNTNYALLGWVIEKAAGMPYEEFMKKRVFEPLGMKDTLFMQSRDFIKGRASGYFSAGPNLMSFRGTGSIASDGTIVSTVGDMAKWDAALNERKLLKPESYRLIWSPGRLNSGRHRLYGMGWDLSFPWAPESVGHGGNSVGYSAGYLRFAKPRLSVIVLGNVYAFSGMELARQIAEAAEPTLKVAVPVEGTDPSPARTERVMTALKALAERKADPDVMEPEMMAPLQTGRAAMAAGASPLRNIKELKFAGEIKSADGTWVNYRTLIGQRMFTLRALVTIANKVVQISLTGDPMPPRNPSPGPSGVKALAGR